MACNWMRPKNHTGDFPVARHPRIDIVSRPITFYKPTSRYRSAGAYLAYFRIVDDTSGSLAPLWKELRSL